MRVTWPPVSQRTEPYHCTCGQQIVSDRLSVSVARTRGSMVAVANVVADHLGICEVFLSASRNATETPNGNQEKWLATFRQGIVRLVHWHRANRSAFSGARSGACSRRQRYL